MKNDFPEPFQLDATSVGGFDFFRPITYQLPDMHTVANDGMHRTLVNGILRRNQAAHLRLYLVPEEVDFMDCAVIEASPKIDHGLFGSGKYTRVPVRLPYALSMHSDACKL